MSRPTKKTMKLMATALQQAVAMYCLLIDHAKGESDLTEVQLEAVVDGVCQDAARALTEARRAGLLPPLPDPAPYARAHGDPVVASGRVLH